MEGVVELPLNEGSPIFRRTDQNSPVFYAGDSEGDDEYSPPGLLKAIDWQHTELLKLREIIGNTIDQLSPITAPERSGEQPGGQENKPLERSPIMMRLIGDIDLVRAIQRQVIDLAQRLEI